VEVYLLRHGIAEDHAASGRDEDRRLTDDGRRKLKHVMERARKAGVAPTLILSSPLKRAFETAEIAARELGYASEISIADALTPSSSPHRVWTEIRAHRDEPSILLAGHEPLFSATLAGMLGSARAMVDFKKAALARVDFDSLGVEPRGVLQWLLTAKLA
jgi:phosphohistidine phosphatase